jgi:hypothetical protein
MAPQPIESGDKLLVECGQSTSHYSSLMTSKQPRKAELGKEKLPSLQRKRSSL